MSLPSTQLREHIIWKLALVLLLTSLLTWLYVRANIDSNSHINYTRQLRELQLYDEQLNSRVIASYAGLIENYDAQQFYLRQIADNLDKLNLIPGWISATERNNLENNLKALQTAHRQKALDIDRFQRLNSVVRNSILYLPQAAEQNLDTLPPEGQQALRSLITRLMSYTLTHKSDEQEYQRLLTELLSLHKQPQTEPAANLLQHAQIVLENSPRTLELVNSILNSDSMRELESSANQYFSAYHSAQREANYYQTLLYAISLLLVGYALYALFRIERDRRHLVRAHYDLESRLKAQRRAEDELRLYATVFTNASEGMTITNAEAKIIAVNPAFCHITGYHPDEVIGKTPAILHSGRHNKAFYKKMWDSINSYGQWKGEIWNRRKDGNIYPEWLSITSVTNQQHRTGHYIGVFTDISERKQNEARIHHLAHHDSLTGLPNRLVMQERIQHEIERAEENNLKIAVIFIDLDRFKNINDTLGHAVGDDLLIQVAHRGLRALRETDSFYRQGGDEFVAVLPELDCAQDAGRICSELLDCLCQPYQLAGHELTVSGSAGIAIYPDDGDNATELLRKADLAMYRAKEISRNTYSFFSADISTTGINELLLENDLFGALERDELRLFYQPKVCAATGQLLGAEALMRWEHRVHGLLSPQIFIPLAEESGLISAMGSWAIRTVCAQLDSWRKQGLQPVPVAINISAQQFMRKEQLLQVLSESLAEFSIPVDLIEFELTETMLLGNINHTATTLHCLKDMNIKVSIDDFGTGYSSLSYLHQFPVQGLKIDRSFVSQIGDNGNPARLTAAIIAMAHELGLSVVAEGVETEVQARYLRKHHCDILQGYLHGKPMPAEEFAQHLQLHRQTPCLAQAVETDIKNNG